MRVLQVVRSAYRCTVEEQDDPAVWITRAMQGAGADLALLLCGNAVNYAVEGQDASGLAFGDKELSRPPRLDHDIAGIIGGGSTVYVMDEDLALRGIDGAALVPGTESVAHESLPGLLAEFDQIWYW